MLYFYADWWVVCEQMNPIVDGLEKKYGQDLKFVRVNVDGGEGRTLAREHGSIGQPSFILFDSSGEEVRRLMGAQSVETFEREIERILGQQGWDEPDRGLIDE
jgi:thioredoxin 1